jgi:hypothetical protein
MILRELFYFDKETIEPVADNRYEPEYDTRKTRLTLRQINRARKASELHTNEKTDELNFVRQMYGIAAQAAAAGV